MHSLLQKLGNCPPWVHVVLSGILLGLNAPGHHTEPVGMISLFPFFLTLDHIYSDRQSKWKRKLVYVMAACWGIGCISALIGVPWLTYSVHVFGRLPWGVAVLITGLGYGLEVALALFIGFGIPMLAVRRRGWWDLLISYTFFLMAEPFIPHVFHWSFGGLTFANFPWISQLADVIGSPGLGIYNIGSNLLLLLIWRWKVEQLPLPRKTTYWLIMAYLMLWAVGLTYGVWRVHSLGRHSNVGSQLHVVALQPNFSFDRLVSNQIMGFSVRQHTIQQLLRDSAYALVKFPADSSIPRLVIWPESTFPSAYFKDPKLQAAMKDFVRERGIFMLFHSVDWDETPSRRRFYGISLLIGPDGEVKGRYNKIFRIPFGEYIPGSGLFPFYADWLRKRIPYLSEFEEGKEYTVFYLSDDLRFSAPICFDVFSPTIIPEMVRNGANLAINLSNLVWFGRTNASDQMEMAIRWKAIENRIPMLLASNNGKSVFISALGMPIGRQLGLFEKGSLTQTIYLTYYFSLYREYEKWIHLTFVLLFAVTAILGYWRGKIFDKESSLPSP